MRTKLQLAMLALLAAVACLDVTPASERNRTIVLVPELLRPSMELAMSSFADLTAQDPYRLRYAGCSEVARLASAGDGAVVLTLHPAWADYIFSRGEVSERSPVAIDRLVVVGADGTTARLAEPGELLTLEGGIGVPSMESEAVGMYAREAMIRYGLWSRLESRLTVYPTAAEVEAALDGGEIRAAFALASAARERGRPVLLTIDDAFHQPILVEALLLGTPSPEARSLHDYLVGPQGIGAFTAKGLAPPR